jgi:catechol 2,3-dioxygenase-like lactoylglutathione lyase family enzyme
LALKSGADAMTDEPRQTTPGPILSSISAQLFVANIKSSCDFYTNKLGFAVEFIYGDPPYYAQVIRDNARLALRLVFETVFVGDVRKREHLLSASITVGTANEINQLFLNYQAEGVSFHQALITPSTKLMTLFNWRHIGRGIHKNSSSPPWASPA